MAAGDFRVAGYGMGCGASSDGSSGFGDTLRGGVCRPLLGMGMRAGCPGGLGAGVGLGETKRLGGERERRLAGCMLAARSLRTLRSGVGDKGTRRRVLSVGGQRRGAGVRLRPRGEETSRHSHPTVCSLQLLGRFPAQGTAVVAALPRVLAPAPFQSTTSPHRTPQGGCFSILGQPPVPSACVCVSGCT